MARGRRPGDPPGQRARRRLLPGAAPARAGGAARRRSSAPARSRCEPSRWAAGFDVPDFEHDHELLALRARTATPIEPGPVVTSGGLDIAPRGVRGARHRGARGALAPRCTPGCATARATWSARWPATRCNRDGLSPVAREAADAGGLGAGVPQPVPQHRRPRRRDGLRARRGAARSSTPTSRPTRPRVDGRAARRRSATARPRRRAACCSTATSSTPTGTIIAARIVPPTSQNQASIEARPARLRRAAAWTWTTTSCATAASRPIRNYDPCISCATHFLDLTVDRGP